MCWSYNWANYQDYLYFFTVASMRFLMVHGSNLPNRTITAFYTLFRFIVYF